MKWEKELEVRGRLDCTALNIISRIFFSSRQWGGIMGFCVKGLYDLTGDCRVSPVVA